MNYRQIARLASLFCLLLFVTAGQASSAETASAADPLDWPNWRGPEQNGVSRETGLTDTLDPDSDSLLWKSVEGAGMSTPVVMRGKLYTLVRVEPGTDREQEQVVCIDAATGKTLWTNRFNVFLSDVPAERIGWSCCLGDPATGRVYALGVCGYFQCLDGETGKTIWSRSLSEEFGLLSTYGGRTNVPTLFEDLVLISSVMTGWDEMAVPAHRFLAFDKENGELVWNASTRLRPEDTTYSTPAFGTLGGEAAMVFGAGDGAIFALQPRTGKIIWNYRFSRRGLNVSPVIENNVVYMGHSEENIDDTTMGCVVAIDGTKRGNGKPVTLPAPPSGGPAPVDNLFAPTDITTVGPDKQNGALWRNKEVMVGKSSPVLFDGRLYCLDDSAALYIFGLDGKLIGRKQKMGTIMRGSPVAADGKIYLSSATGWAILKPNDKGVQKVAQGRYADGEDSQGSPVVSHGRVYITTTNNLLCFAKPGAKPAANPRPAPLAETPVGSDAKPAWVQIKPAEALLKPGDTQKLSVRLFNARGQFLKESDAQFTTKGGGKIGADGVLHTDGVAAHSAIFVTAKVGELTGQARVRVVPALPWKFDFADKQVPVTWVGARYRHVIREMDGQPVMAKVTTIPKGTRSQAWMGPTNLHDYTIQADIRGATKDAKLPDMGLEAQRYTLDMMGAAQQLQIRTWTATLRMAKTVPFAWKPDVWYTMKFRASTEGSRAILQGKVWERGTTEPAEWSVTAVDEIGNLTGSPGLFANSTFAEVFYQNISVTPNVESVSRRAK